MNRAARAWMATGLAFVLTWAVADAVIYLTLGGAHTISTGMAHAPRLLVFAIGYGAGGITWGLAFHIWQDED